jgi:UDPglucose 6-dehydrogenase
MRLVEQTISVNTARKRTLANRVRSMLNGELRNKKIAVLGLTFKANTDDMRDSPSLSLIRALQNDGAIV